MFGPIDYIGSWSLYHYDANYSNIIGNYCAAKRYTNGYASYQKWVIPMRTIKNQEKFSVSVVWWEQSRSAVVCDKHPSHKLVNLVMKIKVNHTSYSFFENLNNSVLSESGVPGVPWNPQNLADQLTLSQPGGLHPPHYYWPPWIFSPSYDRVTSKVCLIESLIVKAKFIFYRHVFLRGYLLSVLLLKPVSFLFHTLLYDWYSTKE